MKKADWILIAAAFVLAAAFLVFWKLRQETAAGTGRQIQIQSGDQVIGIYAVDEDLEIPVWAEDGYNLVVIENGSVYVREADCANQVCVNTGSKSGTGETICCLPHKLLIIVE